MEPKYPEVEVQLSGEDGNRALIIGRTMKALRRHGVKQDEIDEFIADATSGDSDHVLQTVMRWVTTD